MSIPILFPRQNGKSMLDLWNILNGALQNKLNNTVPSTDTLYKEQKSTFALDSLYDENENTFHEDKLYNEKLNIPTPSYETVSIEAYEKMGESIRSIADKWINCLATHFVRF